MFSKGKKDLSGLFRSCSQDKRINSTSTHKTCQPYNSKKMGSLKIHLCGFPFPTFSYMATLPQRKEGQ